MLTIADTLRARWKPTYATRVTDGSHAFETALSFIGAGAAKRAELAKPGTLSPKGIADGVRDFASKGVVPELKKFRALVATDRANLQQRRNKLGKPTIDPTDAAAAVLRQEYRSYLRSLPMGDRTRLVLSGDDPVLVAAALEVPTLSGLPTDIHAKAVEAYIARTAGPELAALEEADEALSLVEAAIKVAENDLSSHLDMQQHEFRQFLEAA